MEIILTASIPLLLLASVLKGLQNKFYALHIFIVSVSCWLMQTYIYKHTALEIFSYKATKIAIIWHLLSINVVTWLAYYDDKKSSISGGWRIPERTLHAFTLIGGTPSAWIAQKKLRHKNRKQSFQLMFWFIFMLQLAFLGFLLIRH